MSLLISCGGGGGGNNNPDNTSQSGSPIYFGGNNNTNGIELWKSDGTPANTSFVKDINLNGHSEAANFIKVANTIYFSADDGIHGRELWKYDTNGASMVKDIYTETQQPPKSGKFDGSPSRLTAFNNLLIFTARTDQGTRLWATDGSENGTVQISTTYMNYPVEFKGMLYFSGIDGIWRTDGTALGTELFLADDESSNLTATADLLFFPHSDENGRELWSSDGTPAGTQMVVNINGTADGLPNSAHKFFVVGSSIYYSARDVNGVELWTSDGTVQGTQMVKDINPGTGSSFGITFSPNFAYANNLLFFTASNGIDGNELWVSNGTDAGTRQVLNINNNSFDSIQRYTSLISFNNRVFFSGNDNDYSVTPANLGSGSEIYISDGTAQGTQVLKDINPAESNGVTNITNAIYNGELYFVGRDPLTGQELWKTDGTETGTIMVKDIVAGVSNSSIGSLVATDTGVFFSANDGVNGSEMWMSTGDSASTSLLADINKTTLANSYPSKTVTLGDFDLFVANQSKYERHLYRTDGTEQNTVSIFKVEGSGAAPGKPPLFKLDNQAYFINAPATTGADLWKSDGTTAGTVIVKDITSAGEGNITFRFMDQINDLLYFITLDSATGNSSLWQSDGTADGTVLINEFTSFVRVSYMTSVNGKLIFPAWTALNGIELWVSDGTAQGTKMLRDIKAATEDGLSDNCTQTYGDNCTIGILNNAAYFVASDGSAARQLWKTDGTSDGTVPVTDLDAKSPNGSNYYDSRVYAVNDKIVAQGQDDIYGLELWVSDGTADGTSLLKDLKAGTESVYAEIIPFDNKLLFFARTDFGEAACPTLGACEYSDDIWVSDGTSSGTQALKAGLEGFTQLLGHVIKDNRVYFGFETKEKGKELWVSDGSIDGTYLVKDINPGPADGVALFDD